MIFRNEINYWGKFPGHYETDKNEKYTIYGYNAKNATDMLSVKTLSENSYKINQQYDNISYNPLVSFLIIKFHNHTILD